MPKARARLCARGLFWALTHDGYVPFSPSIGKTASSPGADVKSAGGCVQPSLPAAARAFVSAPASTAPVIAPIRPAFTSNR